MCQWQPCETKKKHVLHISKETSYLNVLDGDLVQIDPLHFFTSLLLLSLSVLVYFYYQTGQLTDILVDTCKFCNYVTSLFFIFFFFFQELAATGDQFDMVFIDADKSNYINYYNFIMDNNLLRLHGLICVDNSLFKARVYLKDTTDSNDLALRDFNQFIANDPRVEQVLLWLHLDFWFLIPFNVNVTLCVWKVIIPLRDGISLIRRVSLTSAHLLSQVQMKLADIFLLVWLTLNKPES